jgi:hypothetical protein
MRYRRFRDRPGLSRLFSHRCHAFEGHLTSHAVDEGFYVNRLSHVDARTLSMMLQIFACETHVDAVCPVQLVAQSLLAFIPAEIFLPFRA